MTITYEVVEKALVAFVDMSNDDKCPRRVQELVLMCEFDVSSGLFNKVILAGVLPAMLKGLAVSEMCIRAFEDLSDEDGLQQADTLCLLKAHSDSGVTYLITVGIRATFANGQLRLLANTIIKQ